MSIIVHFLTCCTYLVHQRQLAQKKASSLLMKMCVKKIKSCIRKLSELQSEFLFYDFRQIGFSRYSMQLVFSLSGFQIKVSTNLM